MGHMSPKLKARRGRFGVDGLDPTVIILTPADGFEVALGGSPAALEAVFAATGRAHDDEDGDISANIEWTSNLDGSVGANGGATTLTLTTVGVHTITASITDGTNTATDTITVTVTA